MLQLERHREEDHVDADDIQHWISVYAELVAFLDRAVADLSEGPVRTELESRSLVYRQRLKWWSDYGNGL